MHGTWIAVTAALGLLIGVGFGTWLIRNFEWVSEVEVMAPVVVSRDDMEPLIKDAAERWAAAHGRPEAAGLVADKLSTLYDITYDNRGLGARASNRWWSR